MSWHSGFEHALRADVPLREHTWYQLGGPARWFCEPRDADELAAMLRRCRDAGAPWRVLGCGANVLVPDAGFDGAVFRLSNANFAAVREDGDRVTVGAGADLPKFIRQMIQRGLVGLERLAGIPATVGGALRMNAGGRYGDLGESVREITLVTADGEVERRAAAAIGFRYRGVALGPGVILSATLELAQGDPRAALERHKAIWREKYEQQPPVSSRSTGCVFKNPPGHAAGRLIDEAGLKGTRVGGVVISDLHANFMVAHNGATAADVLELIHLAQERVWGRFAVRLETEIDIWSA